MAPNQPPFFLDPPSDAELAEMLGYREGPPDPLTAGIEGVPRGSDWRGVISQGAYDFIVGWETGVKAYYEGVIKSRPGWPRFASGITIGCGYDLGYHTGAQFLNDWGGRISDGAIQRLRPALGFRTIEPNRRAKIARAQALVRCWGISGCLGTWRSASSTRRRCQSSSPSFSAR